MKFCNKQIILLNKQNMLKRLKAKIFDTELQTLFQSANIDNTHKLVKLSKLNTIIKQYKNNKREIISKIIKLTNSKYYILKIKGLIVAHYLIKKLFDEDLMDLFVETKKQIIPQITLLTMTKDKIKDYVQSQIIYSYENYLSKFCINIESYQFAKNYSNNQNVNYIQIINHGFHAINLVNNILQTQESFNKMGRYYIDHMQITSLFLMYLDDITTFNTLFKTTIKQLMKKRQKLNTQELKHYFLYVTQAQKTSDRLYEFFYNRYYYSQIKQIMYFPTFLMICNEQFNELRKQIKFIDKKLFTLVKESSLTDNYLKTLTQKKNMNKTFNGVKTESNFDNCKQSFLDLTFKDNGIEESYQFQQQ